MKHSIKYSILLASCISTITFASATKPTDVTDEIIPVAIQGENVADLQRKLNRLATKGFLPITVAATTSMAQLAAAPADVTSSTLEATIGVPVSQLERFSSAIQAMKFSSRGTCANPTPYASHAPIIAMGIPATSQLQAPHTRPVPEASRTTTEPYRPTPVPVVTAATDSAATSYASIFGDATTTQRHLCPENGTQTPSKKS